MLIIKYKSDSKNYKAYLKEDLIYFIKLIYVKTLIMLNNGLN